MNAIIYNVLNNKQINGTLFYAFEYYVFLLKYTDLNLIIFGDADSGFIKSIFNDKYNVDDAVIERIIFINRHRDLITLNLKNVMFLDLRSYSSLKPFIRHAKFKVYSNKIERYEDDRSIFYGFYNYQHFNKKTRLKFFQNIHNIYTEKGNLLFVSSLAGDNEKIIKELNLNEKEVLVKTLNVHNENLFKRIDKIIYYHTGMLDVNNRIIVEAYIHNIPIRIIFNGHFNDSVFERYNELSQNGLGEFILTDDDILIKDFLKDCNDILPNCYK